jgi:D-alanyl-D-alanine carboxypeptidase/D-alanyl-D-alanine-endopeptidase (penicillin-binding protein 4)
MRIIINPGTKQTIVEMRRSLFIISLLLFSHSSFSQEKSFEKFLADSTLKHASVSFYAEDAETGETIFEYKPELSLTPASVMKLITTATALELLGPLYTFSTFIGYTGTLNKRSGKLNGDIVIKGGGDPALGSKNFTDHYQDFLDNWVNEIKKQGIIKIEGRVFTDDSYFDYLPVPAKWLWEDAGNYYGAGAYGLSVFDNTCEIHFRTGKDSSDLLVTEIVPAECSNEYTSRLVAAGTTDQGYVFSAPYNTYSWFSGSIPVNMDDFILKASITDPPLLIAKMLTDKLKAEGITVLKDPTTSRLDRKYIYKDIIPITETISPPLKDIIEVLNHESVNLYAEHLIKELGKKYRQNGSTAAGIEVINNFLDSAGLGTDGMFIEDGSGLSTENAITTKQLVNLLIYMKKRGKYFPEYYTSLPRAGKEGTLKNYFQDAAFDSRMTAKSGSMTRVRSYAGYITAYSGKEIVFSIIINNYSGSPQYIISRIEDILKNLILNK